MYKNLLAKKLLVTVVVLQVATSEVYLQVSSDGSGALVNATLQFQHPTWVIMTLSAVLLALVARIAIVTFA